MNTPAVHRCGVVLFDDVALRQTKRGVRRTPGTAAPMRRIGGDGWASIDGGTPFRVKGVTDLASDVWWLTNLEFSDFFTSQLSRHPNAFPSSFLRTELKAVAEEIGASIDLVSQDQSCQALSTVFSRVVSLAVATLGVQIGVGRDKTLAEYIGARVINKHKIQDDLNLALKHAYQPQTICMQTKTPRDWRAVALRRPRYLHAMEVLSSPVPGEFQWQYISQSVLPSDPVARIDWCLAQSIPVLANVRVRQRRHPLASLVSFQGGAKDERSWVCQPELLWLSEYADIEVIGVFVCSAGFTEQDELQTFPSLGLMSFSSYSLGLLAESLWVSMASPRFGVPDKMYAPRAVWYRAVDRLLMFIAASQLQQEGFHVSSYGAGAIWVTYPAGAANDLTEVANRAGLDIPVSFHVNSKTENALLEDENV